MAASTRHELRTRRAGRVRPAAVAINQRQDRFRKRVPTAQWRFGARCRHAPRVLRLRPGHDTRQEATARGAKKNSFADDRAARSDLVAFREKFLIPHFSRRAAPGMNHNMP